MEVIRAGADRRSNMIFKQDRAAYWRQAAIMFIVAGEPQCASEALGYARTRVLAARGMRLART